MTETKFIVYLNDMHRVEGSASTIARVLADLGLPVAPGELDNPGAARSMLFEFWSMGLIRYTEEPS